MPLGWVRRAIWVNLGRQSRFPACQEIHPCTGPANRSQWKDFSAVWILDSDPDGLFRLVFRRLLSGPFAIAAQLTQEVQHLVPLL